MKTIDELSKKWSVTDRISDDVTTLLTPSEPYIKLREYYVITQLDFLNSDLEGCPNHFVALVELDKDNELLTFGCSTCGYREDWGPERRYKSEETADQPFKDFLGAAEVQRNAAS